MKKLIPTIIQDYKSKAVYMLGYSSVKSLKKTKISFSQLSPCSLRFLGIQLADVANTVDDTAKPVQIFMLDP